MAVARRETICGGGSSGGVAFCQGDWDVNSQGRERERLATGIVGHFELWLRVGLLKRRGYLSNARGNPGVSRRPFVLFWSRVCMGVCIVCIVCSAAAESCVQAGGGGRLRRG